ncbi:MlaC/ttg2D family ABC transporter substrate-binding protein [Pseudocolwellia sp. HL-MZ19]|uniref:MlaC/ttg2D family ABC transporter substrate-binding protein n=1 Tax=unclassified Pseudocolwellia TaxID=2848178 RepID=UPI003CE9AE46
MKNIFSLFSFITALFMSVSAYSVEVVEVSPYKVIETVGHNLFERIANNQQEIEKFPDLMRNIVDEELMPYIDYRYAAYKILGKNLQTSTKEQRENFVLSMRQYLIRTYANALTQYKDQKVTYEPEKDTNGKNIVSVTTQIIDGQRPTIDIDFKLRKNRKTLEWKAFDMVVEGISLLSSKQAELSTRIAKEGIETVTLELASITK